jgi:hypothetical protein
MRFVTIAFVAALLLTAACEASVGTGSATCNYTLNGAALIALPANAYPTEWVDTNEEFRITLVDRKTGTTSELLVPDCKRDEARRAIADRRAQEREQSSKGVPLAEHTYQ